MATYVFPVTFPDLDSAQRDGPSLLDALRIAGVDVDLVGKGDVEPDDEAGRRDPGPVTREFRVRAESLEEARGRVHVVTEGQYPPGMVLVGDPSSS